MSTASASEAIQLTTTTHFSRKHLLSPPAAVKQKLERAVLISNEGKSLVQRFPPGKSQRVFVLHHWSVPFSSATRASHWSSDSPRGKESQRVLVSTEIAVDSFFVFGDLPPIALRPSPLPWAHVLSSHSLPLLAPRRHRADPDLQGTLRAGWQRRPPHAAQHPSNGQPRRAVERRPLAPRARTPLGSRCGSGCAGSATPPAVPGVLQEGFGAPLHLLRGQPRRDASRVRHFGRRRRGKCVGSQRQWSEGGQGLEGAFRTIPSSPPFHN